MPQITEIYLPASAPENESYGQLPPRASFNGNGHFAVRFEIEVWYNSFWRQKTVDQIAPSVTSSNILLGFSKSGLGALNIAIENPKMFDAVVIFDAPLMHLSLPPWNTSDFYTQETWERDLPQNHMESISMLSAQTRIIHIGGRAFHEDHLAFQALCEDTMISCEHHHHPEYTHSWTSGWVEEALASALAP
ncbi:MAG: hypothetical protein HOH43_12150 [Candidatus Latescibacteria bacterium]|jgi:hypothetical protein|nr:hypothetical protein [Candidatus Latescibacterota bacterium]